MIRAIFLKEWLKLKYYSVILGVILVAVLGHFYFNLNFAFRTIEPESMMWYRFVHLGDKPYLYLSTLYLFFGATIALVQFLPERIKNRIKIMAHLPLELKQSLFTHLGIGVGFIWILLTITSLILLEIVSIYYPKEIVFITFKDTLVYGFLSVVLYIGLSAAIIERSYCIAGIKFFITLLVVIVLLKEVYILQDTLWILLLVVIPFMALDSFYSIKQQRLNSLSYNIALGVVLIALVAQSYLYYKQNYQHEFNRYYIFYSNIVKDFVYQKNYGGHQFEYGIKDKRTFSQEEYESYLPFVYWRDFDIQKKLPVIIDKQEFDKKSIKNARLGFSYHPKMLTPLEVKLYPFLNPDKEKGMIVFPEEAYTITKSGAVVYDFDHKKVDFLSDELSVELTKNGFNYPALHIWGKATNMKPYDKGYLIMDSKKQLFNLYRANDTIVVKKIEYPKGIDLAYVKISENKQKQLSGYAIDSKSNFYLLSWDFGFIKLDLDQFNYKSMKLKLISNPLNYLIRYDDGENYYATVFVKGNDLQLKKVQSVVFK